MKVICISGKAQNGKDSTAEALRASLENDGHSVLIAHYGDLVKYVCKQFFAWNGEKDEYGRSLLQSVGTDVIRAARPDYWVDFVTSILELFPDEWDYVLIPDSRFPNEIEAMKEKFHAIHIRVDRPGFISPLTPEQQAHPSETALDGYPADHYIINDGTLADLRKKTASFAFDLNGVHQFSFEEI